MVTPRKVRTKDSRKYFARQAASYLSVVVITLLFAVSFLGADFAAKSISVSGDEFYDSCNYRDVEIYSDKLISAEEIENVRALSGVADVEGSYRTSGQISSQGNKTDVMVVSLTDRVNVVRMIEGRLPENENECVIEKSVDEATGLKIGDTLDVRDHDGNIPEYLSRSEYVITGIVYHPDHACSAEKAPGSRYVLVKPEAFDKDRLQNCFMSAEIVLNGTRGLDRFGHIYLARIAMFSGSLNKLSIRNQEIRYNEVLVRAGNEKEIIQKQLDAWTDDLKNTKDQLDADWKDYDEKIAEFRTSRREYNESLTSINQAYSDLQDLKTEIEKTKKQLADDKTAFEKTEADLKTAKTKLDKDEKEIKKAKDKLMEKYKPVEGAKAPLRNSLKSAVTSVLGSSVAGRINWSKGAKKINPDDAKATATKVSISSKITVDLNKNVRSNLYKIISSLRLSEEALANAYEAATGNTLNLENGSALQQITNFAADNYSGKFGDYLSDAKEWDTEHAKYAKDKKAFDKAKKEYDDAVKKLASDKKTHDTRTKSYEQSIVDYNEGMAEYQKSVDAQKENRQQFSDEEKALADVRAKLEVRDAEYNEAQYRLKNKKADFEIRQSNIGSAENCRWMAVDGRGNSGYHYIYNARSIVRHAGMLLGFLFAAAGALVIYATVGHLAEQQKQQIASSKAMGFKYMEILKKYLIFGVTAVLTGMVAGGVIGYFGINKIVFEIYEKNYVFGSGDMKLDVEVTVITLILGIILSGLISWLSCKKILESSAVKLLNKGGSSAKAKTKKHSRSKKSGRNSILRSMTAFNMRSDKKRVVAAITCIAVCTAVLVSGLTMNININKTVDQQYKNIELYDLKISFDLSESRKAEYDIGKILEEEGAYFVSVSENDISVGSNKALSDSVLICADLESLDAFFVRRDTKTLAPTTKSGYGIWLPVRMAESNRFAADSDITLYDHSMNPYLGKVAGIYENRVGNYSVMERRVYAAIFGKLPVNNAYYVLLNNANADSIRSRVSAVEGFAGIEMTSDRYNSLKNTTSILELLPAVYIFIVALMAFFVLYNLFRMSVVTKKDDLAMMKLNGFPVKEMKRYVSLELIIDSVVGIVAGLIAGTGLGYVLLMLVQGSDLHIIKTVRFETWGIAVPVMAFVCFAVSIFAMRKVRRVSIKN